MLFWSPAQQWNCCRYKLISKYERRQIFVGSKIFSSTLTGSPTLLQGVRGFLADVLSGWCGRKNTGGLNYELTLPSVTLEDWGQFGWLVWVFVSSVSFSAAGEHRFAASSQVASLTWLLFQQQHLTNSYLLSTKNKAEPVPRRTSREGWKKQTVKQRYKTKWCILSSTDHTSGTLGAWAGNLCVEWEKNIQMWYCWVLRMMTISWSPSAALVPLVNKRIRLFFFSSIPSSFENLSLWPFQGLRNNFMLY